MRIDNSCEHCRGPMIGAQGRFYCDACKDAFWRRVEYKSENIRALTEIMKRIGLIHEAERVKNDRNGTN